MARSNSFGLRRSKRYRSRDARRGRVPSCRTPRRTVVSLARRPVLFALARALGEAWPEDLSRDALVSRHSMQSTPTNRTAHAYEWRLGGFAPRLPVPRERERDRARIRADVAPRARRRRAGAARRRSDAAVIAFLADGESWSSSALALALGTGPRAVRPPSSPLAKARWSPWPRASTPLDDRARARIHDNLVTPRSTAD